MTKSYRVQSFTRGLQFSCMSTIKQNKGKLVLTFLLVLVAIFTGVFVAIKANSNFNLGCLQEINVGDFYSGFVASSSAFLTRCLSLFVNVLILSLLSLTPFLFPLAEILFVYRGYLFGLNFALLFIFYGFGGMFTAIVVVLPCQLATIFALILFYLIFSKECFNSHKFGHCDFNKFLFIILALVILLALNLVETLLLFLLNGKVILVI